MEEKVADVVKIAREFHARGWLPATAGNLSVRLDDKRVCITASGTHKGHITEKDFVIVDYEGNTLEGKKKPSAETLLHLMVYKSFPDVNAVFHVHTINSTLVSRFLEDKVILKDYELLKAFDGIDTHESVVEIPIFQNMQDMRALSNILQKAIDKNEVRYGFLLKSHGIYAWGKDTMDAYVKLEALDFLFDCELRSMHLQRSSL
ncbi:methylthioribulose 1-phosphate dehydratase [Hydrogenobaculum sp.]|nr:MAG: methylthioribulose-1-phosphate dehydratase [Hydrogenobaculum sp.]